MFSLISVVIDGAFVTFRMFIESDLKDPLSQANVEILALVFNFVLICWPKTNLIRPIETPNYLF